MAQVLEFRGKHSAVQRAEISPAEVETLAAQVVDLVRASFPQLGPAEIRKMLLCAERQIDNDTA
jgi:hypothetical protein